MTSAEDDRQDRSRGSGDVGEELGEQVDAIAADVGVSGVIRVDVDGSPAGNGRTAWPTVASMSRTPSTRSSVSASGTKSLTALTVMSLVERGELDVGHDGPIAARRRPRR